jgi:ABC-type polar amino acid transport system ATPase subunit
LIAYRDIQLSPHLSLASWSRQSKELRRHVGIVFQHLHLFPHMTVLENLIRAPMLVLGRAKSAAVSRAEELITRVGLEGVIDRYPEALSRGEQQLVALLRSLLVEPAILLMDEPTSGLDPQRGSDLSKLLREYAALGHTLIIVSHQMSFLKGLADDLLFLQQGRVIEHARTDTLLSSPQTEPTRQFLIHI